MPPVQLSSIKAKFRTHLNYIKCLERHLSVGQLTVSPRGTFARKDSEIARFVRLFTLTSKSLKKDYELSSEDNAMATILTPWFPVKCYYALYYLESALLHLVDGGMHGFSQGGHTRVRKMLRNHVTSGAVKFSSVEINNIYQLQNIASLPSVSPGITTTLTYHTSNQCTDSVAKKLLEYNIHNAKATRNWNLYTNVGRNAKAQYIASEQLMLLDFFYWYRIKANYRDLDYIDFENGLSETEVFEYMDSYYEAFKAYANLLIGEINRLRRPP